MADLQQWRESILSSPSKPSTDRLSARKALHGLIHVHFDAGELNQLCYDLGILHDDLGSGGHDTRIMELILMVIRLGRRDDLLKRLRELRPGVDWPDGV